MSITKRIAFGAAASWFSRGVTIVLALVLMPVLFHHLAKEELGVWLLLAQTSALLFILDMGLGPTLTRRIALAKGKSGSDPETPLNEETRREIADLVESGRRIYRVLAVGTFLVSGLSGFIYLQHLHLTTLSLPVVWTAWGILCLSQAFGVWAQVWNCLLSGVGYVGWDAVLGSFISTITLLAQIVTLYMGGGLVALATVAAVGLFAQRYLLLGFARSRRPELFHIRGNFDGRVVRSMISPSLRAWVTGVGILMVLNTDQFFIASMNGAAQIPAYRAAYLVLYNLDMMAASVAGASAVFVSHLWQAGEIAEVHRVVVRNLRLGLGIMAAGGACVLVLGPRLFDVWLGRGNYIGLPILCIFFVLLLLEAQCYIITLGSRATEDEAFAFWALGAGVLKLTLSVFLGVRFGLLGIASSTLIAELATNHWYMVYRGLKRLRIGFESHVMNVLLPVAGLFVAVMVAVWLPISENLFPTEGAAVLGSGAISGVLLAAFMWFFVLERGHRTRLYAWCQLARQ
ncbi:MAG TPA: lipopolysaccharide biosynthesis protein [Candidatus Methylacidiphilales bacterium]|nr:lipopolysaccharide biosynthesis protein [Candidatus Methylacidiphilales bacterium]